MWLQFAVKIPQLLWIEKQQKDIYQKSLLLLGIGIYNEVPGYLIDWWGYMSSSILQSAKITVNKTTIELGNR